MKKNFLLSVLVLPLTIGAAVLMAASFFVTEPWRSLFVNLAAGLVGSIITVVYIEKIIRRNERYEWTKVMAHILRQVNILANGTTSSVRTALGLKMPLSPRDREIIGDPRLLRAMMIELIEGRLLPGISGLAQMDQNDWRKFSANLAGSMKDAERLLSLFSKHLNPTIVGLILDIHEQARALLLQYQTWPDMLGVPFDQMKLNNRGESIVPYFQAVYKQVVQDAEQLLKTCANLLREVDLGFPASDKPKG